MTQERDKILLVEDDEIDILAFERAIRKTNLPFDITVNQHPSEILELVSKENFSCIFLDYMLPQSDGLSLLKKLQAGGSKTPVVIVTAQGNERIAVEMMKSGALDYITKEEITAERIAALVHTANVLRKSEIEKEQAENSLKESRQLLANIFDLSSVGMLLLNDKSTVVRANKAFEEICEKPLDEVVEHPFDEIFTPPLLIADLLNNPDSSYEFTIKINGATKYLSVNCNPFSDDTGNYYLIISFYDITAKVSNEREILWQNTRMEALLESTSSVIFSIDANNLITGYNKAARKVFKTFYNVDIEVGMDALSIPFDADNHHMMRENFAKAFSGKRVTVVHKINKLYFETTFNPIKTDEKSILGVSIFSQDITQEKNNEINLIEAKKEAEELAKTKSQFLSNMSHEIRTPMNAIIGLTNLLLEDQLTEKQRENLNTLKFSADNLLIIINDILDLSKIESGKITFEEIDFSCEKIIEQIVKTFSFQLRDKDVQMSSETDTNVPAVLLGDPYRLTQILNNLVGNAVKFTSEGSVKITCQFLNTTEDGQARVEFKVTDTGIGIHKDKLGSIFESFTQAYTDTTRKFGGTGLGLAITKKLVEAQGGEITVDSEPKKGTTFTFVMPFKTSEENKLAGLDFKTVPDTMLHGLKVLIAEDNKANQLVIRQILSRWNIVVNIKDNGREAIDYLEQETPDIVFMDLQMPEMSGFDAIEVIRNPDSKVLNHNVPVLALTADVFPETRDRIFSSGMNDFLLKPLNLGELKEKLVKYGVLLKQEA